MFLPCFIETETGRTDCRTYCYLITRERKVPSVVRCCPLYCVPRFQRCWDVQRKANFRISEIEHVGCLCAQS